MPAPIFSTESKWFDFIQECRTSGMNDKDFCRQHGISTASLYRHIKKLREKACEIPPHITGMNEVVKVYDGTEDSVKTSMPVLRNGEMKSMSDLGGADSTYPTESGIRISYKGYCIEIARSTDRALLQDTLRILQGLC